MRKVFILGAHRSGTSKLASYFREVLQFRGYAEGHIFRLLSHLQAGFRDIRSTIPDDAYEINRISYGVIERQLTLAIDSLICAHHSGRDYYDKTPGYQMIDAAHWIARHIPEARFLHVHRNGMDNVNSNLRLWPDRDFEEACAMWADSVRSFQAIRPVLGDRLLPLTMHDIASDAWGMHGRICDFLDLKSPATETEINNYFATGSVSSTRAFVRDEVRAEPTLADQSWTAEQKAIFVRVCAQGMRQLGYPLA